MISFAYNTYSKLSSTNNRMVGGMAGGYFDEKFSEEKLGMDLKQLLKESKDHRKEYDKKLDKFWMDFRDIKPVKLIPHIGAANWSVPIASNAEIAIVPRFIEGICGFDPPVVFKPVTMEGDFVQVPYTKFMNWFYKRMKLENKIFYPYFMNVAWSGTSYAYVYMNMEQETREEYYTGYMIEGVKEPVRDPNSPNGILQVTEENTRTLFTNPVDPQTGQPLPPVPFKVKNFKFKRKVWKVYDPTVKIIETKDIYFPGYCTGIQDAWDNDWIFIREWVTKDYLRRMITQDKKSLYKNLDKIKIKGLDTRLETESDVSKKNWLKEYAEKTNKIEIWRCLGNADIDNDGINEKVIALMNNDGIIFGFEEFPYIHKHCPVIEAKMIPLNDKPFGIGLSERLADTKGFLDDFYCSVTDRIRYQNDPPIMHTRKSGYSSYKHKRGYGRDWLLNDISPDNIRLFELPKGEFNTFQLIQSFQNWGDRISSIDARSGGVEDPGSKNLTKGGIEAVIAEGNILFRQYVRNLVPSVEEIYFQLGALLQQYWGDEADIEINERVRQIMDMPDNPLRKELQTDAWKATGVSKYDAIRYSFNVEIVAGQRDREKEISRGFQTYQFIKDEPLYEGDPERKISAIKMAFKSMGYTEDESESIKPRLEIINQRQVAIQKQALAELQKERDEAEAEAQAERELM